MPYSHPYDHTSSAPQQNKLHALKFYRFHAGKKCWKHIAPGQRRERVLHSDLSIITWNVDFTSGKAVERINEALHYLRYSVLQSKTPPPCVILLQEVHSKVLPAILENPWIQKHFYLTPIDNLKWPYNIYGNITLIERSVSVINTEILWFAASNMGRTALVTDVRLAPLEPELYEGRREVNIRIVNTHLESLDNAENRAEQLALCVELLKEEPIYAGVIGGDFNAFDEDSTEQVKDHGLVDTGETVEKVKGKASHTWGFHEKKPSKFPSGRFDKIVFTPRGDLSMSPPVIFGQDATTEDGEWVSDHYGLRTNLAV